MCNNHYLNELEIERRAMQDGFEHFEDRPKEKDNSKYAIPFYFVVIFISAFLLGFYIDSLTKVLGG